jgi:L-lactate utilization protein LutC
VELEALLSVVRQRLERAADGATGVLPQWRPPDELFVADPAARLALFVTRARESGATVEILPSRVALEPAVLELLGEHGWRTMIFAERFRTPAFEALSGAEPAAADFGLCEAVAAAAETGSVMLAHDPGNPRRVSLLPPAVGFLVRASSIVSRITELLELLDERGAALESCLTLVRGPSRSADIGSVTCFGAHGPGMVYVWVVEDE